MAGRYGQDLQRRRSSVTFLCYHVVFTTKYRRKVITARVLDTLIGAFNETCDIKEWRIREVNGEADHVHMLLSLPPKVALSDAVRVLKANSSRIVRSYNFPEVRKRLWGDAFWSASHFAVTCGGAPLDIIKRYIENQNSPS